MEGDSSTRQEGESATAAAAPKEGDGYGYSPSDDDAEEEEGEARAEALMKELIELRRLKARLLAIEAGVADASAAAGGEDGGGESDGKSDAPQSRRALRPLSLKAPAAASRDSDETAVLVTAVLGFVSMAALGLVLTQTARVPKQLVVSAAILVLLLLAGWTSAGLSCPRCAASAPSSALERISLIVVFLLGGSFGAIIGAVVGGALQFTFLDPLF